MYTGFICTAKPNSTPVSASPITLKPGEVSPISSATGASMLRDFVRRDWRGVAPGLLSGR